MSLEETNEMTFDDALGRYKRDLEKSIGSLERSDPTTMPIKVLLGWNWQTRWVIADVSRAIGTMCGADADRIQRLAHI